MKINLESVDDVFNLINIAQVRNEISGVISKNVRPTNSNKEDIVINSLTLNNQQLQRGIVNVNVHVPNLQISTSTGIDNEVPDHTRLSFITKLIVPLLKDIWSDNWDIDIEQINLVREDKSSFNNIRVTYQSINV